MILRPYQREAVDACYQHWVNGTIQSPLIVAPTGSGKSAILGTLTAVVTSDPDSRVVVLTHRSELIEQDSKAIRTFTTEPVGIYSAQLKRKEMKPRIIVGGIASIYKRACDFEPFDVAIIDECFVKGTKVSTPSGLIDIDKVRCGDIVLNQTGVGTVEAISCKFVSELTVIEVEDGRVFECTKNHPFFTASGWVNAGDLERGTRLLGIQDMSMLWESFWPVDEERLRWESNINISGKLLEQANLLLSEVCKEVSTHITKQTGQVENQQEAKRNKTQTYKAWRERAIASFTSIGVTACAGGRLDCGTSDQDQCGTQEWVLSELLQSGYSKPREDDCDRTRRVLTHDFESKRTRHQKNGMFSGSRVVSVSNIKRESPEPVFNLQVSGHPSYFVDGIAVHNCHLLSRNQGSMYGRFLKDARLCNPRMKLVGLSATHYRLDSGYLHKGKDALFDGIAYEIGVKMLLEQGYLCPLVSKSGVAQIDLSEVHKRGGEYIASELAHAADNDILTRMACDEICAYGKDRHHWMIFCAGVQHAYNVRDAIRARGFTCETVTGDLSTSERTKIYEAYDRGEIRCITNCQVLTTGFDQPQIDLIALLTSTESTGLYVQMVGRGTRIHSSKSNCLLLDYGSNVTTHGCFDDVRPKFKGSGSKDGEAPAKKCPQCNEVVHAGLRHCTNCGHEFPPPEVSHSPTAYEGAVLTHEIKPETIEVTDVRYRVHKKIGKPDSVRIDYDCGLLTTYSEWICPEHQGYARRKFENRCINDWGMEPLSTCAEVLALKDKLPKPTHITVSTQPGSKHINILAVYYENT